MKHRALLIKDGEISRVEVADDEIHGLIGNWFSLCFNLPGVGHRKIVAYCDDEGHLRKTAPWNVLLGPSVYRGAWPIRGPIVVTAGVGPDTVSMNELEMSALRVEGKVKVEFDGEIIELPVLKFRPGYDT